MAELGNASRVLIVNVKVPRPWQVPNNRMLASEIARYPNAVLVDWHEVGIHHPEIFWKDGIHLRPQGARLYADLLAEALEAPRAADRICQSPPSLSMRGPGAGP